MRLRRERRSSRCNGGHEAGEAAQTPGGCSRLPLVTVADSAQTTRQQTTRQQTESALRTTGETASRINATVSIVVYGFVWRATGGYSRMRSGDAPCPLVPMLERPRQFLST
jgi:hypothetical protein